tara:strand:- start:175 stop:1257 length:1083 start_codon:yes stop_codon:yes gene_type:complete
MIDIIAGARPNFMKIAPLIKELRKRKKFKYRLIHTGQHFDSNMSKAFFDDLKLPKPDIHFKITGKTHSEQTGQIMNAYEKVLKKNSPSLVVVVGDVNSTLAASIVAKKMQVKVAHVEAGLRSKDFTMPEEINRILTDSISDFFFTTTKLASENLINSGFKKKNIFHVGNLMIDSLKQSIKNFENPKLLKKYNLEEKDFLILTIHRPNNVDNKKNFNNLLHKISKAAKGKKIIFPIHPRSKKNLSNHQVFSKNLKILNPLPYNEFIFLLSKSKGVLTDSGGITEESSYLNIPCITLRDNTERPETEALGTNFLIGSNPSQKNLKNSLDLMFSGNWKSKNKIPKWDGQTAERICNVLDKLIL